MGYYVLCLVVLLLAYGLNILYTTVFYHRGLTHRAVTLAPWVRKLVIHTGNWVTGLDPKGWSCMHRLHHIHTDTPRDPHSPVHQGLFKLMLGQLHSYQDTLRGLKKGNPYYTSVVPDLDFPVNWLNRKKVWYLPYLLHAAIGVAIGYFFGAWLLGYCYWVGIMSHPLQGWMVNALGHAYGYRNYDTPDNSRNNSLVAWLVMGEGYQNNHHRYPASAKFSVKRGELDMGYGLVKALEWLGMIRVNPQPA